MLVTSQLPIETTKFAIISFQYVLVPPPHFEKGSDTHAYGYDMYDTWFSLILYCCKQMRGVERESIFVVGPRR